MTDRIDRDGAFAALSVALLVGALVAAGTAAGSGAGGETVERPEYAVDPIDPPTADGVATVDGERYGTVSAALSAADPGDVVRLAGRFDETVVVETPNVTLAGGGPGETLLHGDGEGDVLAVRADGVTVRGLWVRNAGREAATNDAAILVAGDDVAVRDGRITETTFGVWLDGVEGATVANNTIVGREEVARSERGNGIQIWKTEDAVVADNRITDARDGIYYSWASGVTARDNRLWDLRYGVHYMYSDDCRLADNSAVGNDVGYALMLSQGLTVANNTAVANDGSSGHGLLLKSIDRTTVRDNHLVANGNGLYLYNSLDNDVDRNLLLENEVGVHLTAGSAAERVARNTFVRNDQAVWAVVGEEVTWNGSVGNYWAGADATDVDGDGIADGRHRPAGAVERLVAERPAARVFASSPAFDAVRRAERTVPALSVPGVVDERPLTEPRHDWRAYYARD